MADTMLWFIFGVQLFALAFNGIVLTTYWDFYGEGMRLFHFCAMIVLILTIMLYVADPLEAL